MKLFVSFFFMCTLTIVECENLLYYVHDLYLYLLKELSCHGSLILVCLVIFCFRVDYSETNGSNFIDANILTRTFLCLSYIFNIKSYVQYLKLGIKRKGKETCKCVTEYDLEAG